MPYDPDELAEDAESFDPDDFSLKGEIVNIEQKEAQDIFGDKTLSSPDKEMLEVTVETEAGDKFNEVFSLPVGTMSWANPQFKLGQFKEYYDDMPREGMKVELSVDENGFLSIEY